MGLEAPLCLICSLRFLRVVPKIYFLEDGEGVIPLLGTEQGRPIQIWLGALPPDFPIIGGGQNCPPPISNIGEGGGKILKIPTYLVLKGRNFFRTLLKLVFLTFHEGHLEKSF